MGYFSVSYDVDYFDRHTAVFTYDALFA